MLKTASINNQTVKYRCTKLSVNSGVFPLATIEPLSIIKNFSANCLTKSIFCSTTITVMLFSRLIFLGHLKFKNIFQSILNNLILFQFDIVPLLNSHDN
jgi:hypothetical protein